MKYIAKRNIPVPDTNKLISSGYWNDKVYINSEGHSLNFDIRNKSCNNFDNYFKITNSIEEIMDNDRVTGTNKFNGKDRKYRFTISWKHSIYGSMKFFVDYYPNPQVGNMISLNTKLLRQENATGLFVKNYKPKYMEINLLTKCKCNKLNRLLGKAERDLHENAIVSKDEMWLRGNHQEGSRLVTDNEFNKM
jgi:hypothetical protein